MLKEPEIKLFGRNIYLPDNGEWSNESSSRSGDCDRCLDESRGEEEILEQREEDAEEDLLETSGENEDEDDNTNTISESKTPPSNEDDEPKTENESNSQKKGLKKPDKILPCPRCKSMDTKFCYYNNYNVNQPRHFCKSCQRYWTAGGTMRNVPVGAGRRKNKNSASNCRHITVEAFHSAPNGFHNLKFKPNATVLSFGPDSPLCESMAEKTAPYQHNGGDRVDDSSAATPNPPQNGFRQPAMPVPCIPGVPWPYSAVPVPAFFHPVPYYSAPVWNLPWVSVPPQNAASPPLGKHSRSEELPPLLNPNTPQGKEAPKRKSSDCKIVVPKTLRIDDPEEAAKSSIWSTLGIKYDSINREGLLKAFEPKIDNKKTVAAASPLLQANPAALSRSLAFQETA